MEKKLYHSAAYYPELWPAEQIDEDIAWMKKAGLNAVRMAEFAWSRMEPVEGGYDFDWLHHVVDKLYAAGISSILCTPTATPPAWLSEKHPDILFINREGRRMGHGSRRHYCYNSPVYRDYSRKITERLAREFGNAPGLIGWQTDNEFFCHVQECYCDTCRHKFYDWLKKRFGTVGALNEAWGTHIWSQHYNDFNQIPLPVPAPSHHNPSLTTAFLTFSSESMVEFQKEQLDIIRQYSHQPITHNGMPPFHRLDYDALYADLDFAAMDIYIPPEFYWTAIRELDWMRVKCRAPYWVIETAPGWNGGVENVTGAEPPAFIRAKGLISYGFGGQGVSYWLWRQQRTGCEMVHGSLLYAWGEPTPGWTGVVQLSEDIRKCEEFLLAAPVPQADVAIHYATRSHRMLDVEPMTRGFTYREGWYQYGYKPLLLAGIFRDVLFESGDVKGYKVVFTPYMPCIDDALLAKMEAFVREGGVWVVGPMSGYRTPHHTVHTGACLGKLEALAGVKVVYSFPMTEGRTRVQLGNGATSLARYWGFAFREDCSRSLGVYVDGPAQGLSCISERTLDKGKVVLLGATLDEEPLRELLADIVADAGASYTSDATWGTVAVPRQGEKRAGMVVVNWDGKGGELTLPRPGVDLLTGRKVGNRLTVEPYGGYVIEYIEP